MSDEYIVVGTAGHIDHGKTSLIRALNGFDGDKTVEEKRRGITIDLSFSYLQTEQKTIAFIDVPGHEKLVKNMLGGAFGFDCAMLTVAANEGVMPQTIEHLEILDLLGVENIVVVLTKVDLADEEQILQTITEIKELFDRFSRAKIQTIVRFSIHEPSSVEQLKKILLSLNKTQKTQSPFFRLYIDRIFSVQGRGTVVTGTVLGAQIKEKESVFVQESGLQIQVKGIQIHGKTVDIALAGRRCALVLSNIEVSQLHRGYLLSKKGFLRGFNTIDVFLKNAHGQTVRHDQELQFFIGAKSTAAKVLLTGESEDKKGFYATVKTQEPIFSVFSEPFLLRNATVTVAGGVVLNPIADPMSKKQRLALSTQLHEGKLDEAFKTLLQVHKKGFGLVSSPQRFGIQREEALQIVSKLEGVFVDEEALVAYPSDALNTITGVIKKIYDKNQKALLSALSLNAKIKWASVNLLQAALDSLEHDGVLVLKSGLYLSQNHSDINVEEYLRQKIYEELQNGGHFPQAPYNIYDSFDLDRKSGDDAMKSLCKAGSVVRLEHNLFITTENLSNLLQIMRSLIKEHGYVDIAILKNSLNMSRKYAVSYLEYLDGFSDIKKDTYNRRSRPIRKPKTLDLLQKSECPSASTKFYQVFI